MIERYRPSASIEPLLYWVKERESIRKKRLAQSAPPWTDDPILQTYRFCNVMRKHDRVSKWICENVLNFQGEFDDQMIFLMWVALCRWVNWPPTLLAIMDEDLITYDQIDLGGIAKRIDQLCGAGVKAWTGAYMVRAPSKKRWGNMTKGQFVATVVVGEIDRHKFDITAALKLNSVRAAVGAFEAIPNWGTFMAGQIVADLTYTPLLNEASDLNSWAPMGPGSKRGFNRLMGLPLKHPKPSEEVWCTKLQEWREEIVKAIHLPLSLHDVQNCLCEVDKYLRVKNGEGRPRSTYRPETAY